MDALRPLEELKRYPAISVANRALVVLMGAAIVSLLDRQILILLVEPIRADLRLTDTQISILQGLAFALFYSVAALPIGQLVDRINRRNLIIVGIVLWSAATILCGLSRSFQSFLIARLGVGFGEACLNPAAYSLLCDYFPPERRGRAYGLFASAGSAGSGIALLLGTAVFAALGASTLLLVPFLGPLAAWKIVFVICGFIGFVMAVLLAVVPEPPRLETASTGKGARLPDQISYFRGNYNLIGMFLCAFALMSLARFGYVAWITAFYMRSFGRSVPQAGLITALLLIGGGLVGCLLGGWVGDRVKSADRRGGRLLVPLWSGLLSIPALLGWLLADRIEYSVAFGCIFSALGVAGLTMGPLALNELVPNELRGRMAAVYMLIVGLLGIGFGPTAVALVTDYVFRDVHALRYSLLLVTLPASLVASLLIWLMLPSYSRAATLNTLRSAN
jgi:MFS family permease